MKKSDWGIEVVKVKNGFLIKDNDGNVTVVQDDEKDELSVAEKLLWHVIEFFDLRGSRHEPERVSVIREIGDKYDPQKGEVVAEESYRKLVRR